MDGPHTTASCRVVVLPEHRPVGEQNRSARKMKLVIFLLSLFLVDPLYATKIAHKELHELVSSADHVVEGKIIDVVMRNGEGKIVTADDAATGPGSSNQLFLKVEVSVGGFVHSEKSDFPKIIWIPLWQKWHNTLGNRRKNSFGKTYIFLLKGDGLDPVYPAGFERDLSDLPKIKQLIEAGQAGVGQPAAKPADKAPVKGQPSTPTSKDGPR